MKAVVENASTYMYVVLDITNKISTEREVGGGIPKRRKRGTRNDRGRRKQLRVRMHSWGKLLKISVDWVVLIISQVLAQWLRIHEVMLHRIPHRSSWAATTILGTYGWNRYFQCWVLTPKECFATTRTSFSFSSRFAEARVAKCSEIPSSPEHVFPYFIFCRGLVET